MAKREFGRDTVKLHMTVINAKNDKSDDDDEAGNRRKPPKKFDARHILDRYADYEFGSQELNQIHIAVMKSKDADGFYKCTTSIEF